MENIFKTELIQLSNTKGQTAGIGEWTVDNGIPAMDIRPVPFYKNLDNGNISGILKGLFEPNTSYLIDLWVDTDDVIYNGNNVAGGLTVVYTDSSTESFVFTGGNKGFQHKKIITPNTKTINYLNIYYYVNQPVYYRWDSYITKITTQNISNQGQLNVNNTIENQTITSLSKGGSIYLNNFYEY